MEHTLWILHYPTFLSNLTLTLHATQLFVIWLCFTSKAPTCQCSKVMLHCAAHPQWDIRVVTRLQSHTRFMEEELSWAEPDLREKQKVGYVIPSNLGGCEREVWNSTIWLDCKYFTEGIKLGIGLQPYLPFPAKVVLRPTRRSSPQLGVKHQMAPFVVTTEILWVHEVPKSQRKPIVRPHWVDQRKNANNLAVLNAIVMRHALIERAWKCACLYLKFGATTLKKVYS